MSQAYMNKINQPLCERCSKEQICTKVHVMNRGDYFVCSCCQKSVGRSGRYNFSKIDFNNWTPEDTWHRNVVEIKDGDQIYITTRHHTLRIFTVGDDFHQSTDIHVVSNTDGMETKKLQFTSNGMNSLEDTKFLCFSTVESEDE